MIDIKFVSLLDILPASLRGDPNIQASSAAFDQEFHEVTAAIDKLLLYVNLENQSDEIVDLLAWQMHVDFYDSSMPIEIRRELVRNSPAWHKRKGTPAAVEELLTTVFGDGEVEEWFEYGGEPYHFRVVTNNASATNEQAEEFIRAIDSVKNTRSFLEAIIIRAGDELNLYYGHVLHMGEFMTLEQVV